MATAGDDGVCVRFSANETCERDVFVRITIAVGVVVSNVLLGVRSQLI